MSQSAMENNNPPNLAANSRLHNNSPQNSQYSGGHGSGKGQKKKLAGGLSQSAIQTGPNQGIIQVAGGPGASYKRIVNIYSVNN